MKKLRVPAIFLCVLAIFLCSLAAAETDPEKMTFPQVGQANRKTVNVRQSAYAKGVKLEQLKKGDRLIVIGYAYDKDGDLWLNVRTDKGVEGFAAGKYVDILEDAVLTTGDYIGNKNSRVFHRSSCANLPAEKNRVSFSSREEAVTAGFRPCKNCEP